MNKIIDWNGIRIGKVAAVSLFASLIAAVGYSGRISAAPPPPRPDLRGSVNKGQDAFAGARIYILAAAMGQDQGIASLSLINPAVGRLDGTPGPTYGYRYVLADGNGKFC
jgi:hypothetical protein